jgi:ribosomal protein S18 acetylase RimI-like enzyme
MPARPTTPVAIAEAGASDAVAIAAFLLRTWQSSGPDSPGLAGATDELIASIATAKAIRARLGRPVRRMFFAVSNNEVVGMAATRRVNASTVELSGILVSVAASGKGIGTRLVELALNRARADRFSRMIVRTERANERAISFYRQGGFEPVAETVEHIGGNEVPVLELARAIEGSPASSATISGESGEFPSSASPRRRRRRRP